MRSLFMFLAVALLAVSCTVQRRLHQPGYHVDRKGHSRLSEKQEIPETDAPGLSAAEERGNTRKHVSAPAAAALLPVVRPVAPDSTLCDTIVLQSGVSKVVKLEEVGVDVVRYKKCDNPAGPSFTVKKADVHLLKYANGTQDEITPKGQPVVEAKKPAAKEKKLEGFGVAGFVLSLAGLFIAGLPLGFMSVVFGFISISRIMKHPERFSGAGFAVAAILIGLLDVILVLVLVGVVLI